MADVDSTLVGNDTEIEEFIENERLFQSAELDDRTKIGEETRDALTEKIVELFHFCDVENKGYVVKEDLYRLRDELGLEFSDIDHAFEQLDTNKDSYLSMDEFTTGFGLFIGVERPNHAADFPAGAENDEGIKIDFSFQVFNLIDKDDKGHITKNDLIESADTLEIDSSQIDYVYQRLRGVSSDKIYFEDFVNNIGSIVALSPALQEIKSANDREQKGNERIAIIERFDTIIFLQ